MCSDLRTQKNQKGTTILRHSMVQRQEYRETKDVVMFIWIQLKRKTENTNTSATHKNDPSVYDQC